jgi:glycosyltransferase involved in cell wall biosynthesis
VSRALQRVGVNLLYLVPGEVGGVEAYPRELLAALRRSAPELELILYCAPEALDWLDEQPWSAGTTVRPAPGPSRNKPLRALLEQSWLPACARRDSVQLLHSLNATAPIRCPVPSVVTVHDLIFRHFPATFPAAARAGLETIVPRAAHRAAAVLADSSWAKTDIVDGLRVAPERVHVAELAPASLGEVEPTAETDLRRRYGLGEAELVLCVSAAFVHKNLPRLIDAMAPLTAERDLLLLLAGHAGQDADALAAHARGNGLSDRVRLTGWIPRADLEGLYRASRLFVYPSLMEGFGLPVLEAMARGLPVACSTAPALTEVTGGAAALFDPRDTTAMTSTIRRLLDDPQRRAQLIAQGHARVGAFSWERCAQRTLAIYRRVIGAPAPRGEPSAPPRCGAQR